MARESQGLQIALIVFVMLTLIFGVTTFMFYKWFDDGKTATAAAVQEQSKASKDLSAAQNENGELKRILGFNSADTIEVIHQEVNKQMAVAASSLPEADRVYRTVVQHLNDTVQKKVQALALKESESQQWQKKAEDRERDAVARIQEHDNQVKKTGQDLAVVTADFTAKNNEIKAAEDKLLDERTKTVDAANQKVAEAENFVAGMKTKYTTAVTIGEQRQHVIEGFQKPTFETPLGKIAWANQRSGRVVINLGDADGLRRLTSFGVFPANADDVGQVESKAKIEVVNILGPHVAEARIIDDKPSNPIIPGDLIWTPIWAPGKRIHFALVGKLDLDGDGKNDVDRVVNIVTTRGAVVDAYQDATGAIKGKITADTNYLVRGAMPDEKSARSVRANWTELLKKAEENLVKSIKLADLLDRMGYREVNHVTKFGPGANPLDFRAKPPAGGLPVSTAPVSPLFQPRQPPRGAQTEY